MRNDEIAGMLETLANLLEFKGENPFKLNAYRKAARVLRDQTEDVATLVRENRLKELPGIGESIEKKIVQALTTGKIEKLTEALKTVPPGVLRMMEIPGVGPRTAAQVHEKLGINTLEEFTAAARSGKLAGVPGIGAKKAAGISGGDQVRQGQLAADAARRGAAARREDRRAARRARRPGRARRRKSPAHVRDDRRH